MPQEDLPAFIQESLGNHWEELCYLAFDGFTRHGRGTVAIEQDAGGKALASYFPLDLADACVEPEWRPLLAEYDPDTEFIIQFDWRDGLRTVRVRTPEDGQSPYQVWFLEALNQAIDDPSTVLDRPMWFVDFLDRLITKKPVNEKEENCSDGGQTKGT